MDKETKKVVDAARALPDFERSVLLKRMFAVLEGGDESEVFDAALALVEPAKWELVGALLDSLAHLDEDPYDKVWREEIERREKASENDPTRLIPWSEVEEGLKRARARR